MERNTKGNIYWSALSLLLGIVVLPVMLIREYWQFYHYNLDSIEWDDIVRYGMLILIFSLFHWCIADICNLPVYLMI